MWHHSARKSLCYVPIAQPDMPRAGIELQLARETRKNSQYRVVIEHRGSMGRVFISF